MWRCSLACWVDSVKWILERRLLQKVSSFCVNRVDFKTCCFCELHFSGANCGWECVQHLSERVCLECAQCIELVTVLGFFMKTANVTVFESRVLVCITWRSSRSSCGGRSAVVIGSMEVGSDSEAMCGCLQEVRRGWYVRMGRMSGSFLECLEWLVCGS